MNPRLPRSYDKPPGTMVLGLDVVLAAKADTLVDRSALRPPEVALLDLVDGRRTIEEILQLSQTSWFVAMRRLRSLCERGVLVPNQAPDANAGHPRAPGGPGSNTMPGPGSFRTARTEERPRTVDLSDVVGKLLIPTAGSPASSATAPGFTPSAPGRREAAAASNTNADLAFRFEPAAVPPQAPPVSVPPVNERPVTADNLASDPVLAGTRSKRARSFKLGRYEVLARIGQGGMGSVYLCRQPGHWGFQRLFTLKVIREHAAENGEAMRSFLREARIGGMLNHPNILGVVDVGNYNGQPFLVLDYVEGTSLAELLSGGQQVPPANLVVPVLLDALRGLQAAHDQVDPKGNRLGIVHCDVSPQNIIVGLDGAARVTDFGSARQAGEGAPGEEDLPAVGKPGYMSPEQLCGNPLDARTDVFAMGVVMWTALTGKKLFVDPSYEQTIINVLRKKFDPPSAHGAPACLDEVCCKALARAPEGRYQSAEEMRLALHRVASQEGVLASTAEISRWVKRIAGEALEERRRLLTASNEGGADPAPESLVRSEPRPPRKNDPERFRPTIVINASSKRRAHGSPETNSSVETDEVRELEPELETDLEGSLQRRPLLVIVAAALITAAAVLVAQAALRGRKPPPPERRPAVSESYAVPADAGPSLLAPDLRRALEVRRPVSTPRAPGQVDIEVPPAPK
jgi:serine/threonine protein kinase